MAPQMDNEQGSRHAIVIGGSMAGMLAARVLSDYFDRVTLIERDQLPDGAESRKGVPQGRHTHAILARGATILTEFFPDLRPSLIEGGAVPGDMGEARWYQYGGYKINFHSGMEGITMSRPFLDMHIRQRVLARPNVECRDGCAVDELVTDHTQKRVLGVRLRQHGELTAETLYADLVVDASGRGSAAPRWLERLGYGRPPETSVKINVGYATRIYRRDPTDPLANTLFLISPIPPHEKRMAVMFPIEGDRWIATLGGWCGDHAPDDEAGFNEYVRSLAAPDIYELIRRSEPLSDIMLHKFPANLRHHYERMRAFPDGLLVIGDAICSFNPIYGQGMTSSALQAQVLDRCLRERQTGDLNDMWRGFFREVANVVDIPWQLAAGEDFRYPEVEGVRPRGTALINAYVAQVHRAVHHDPVVFLAFLKVMNLIEPPTSLFHPNIVRRVLVHSLRRRFSTRVAVQTAQPT